MPELWDVSRRRPARSDDAVDLEDPVRSLLGNEPVLGFGSKLGILFFDSYYGGMYHAFYSSGTDKFKIAFRT